MVISGIHVSSDLRTKQKDHKTALSLETVWSCFGVCARSFGGPSIDLLRHCQLPRSPDEPPSPESPMALNSGIWHYILTPRGSKYGQITYFGVESPVMLATLDYLEPYGKDLCIIYSFPRCHGY